MQNQHVLAGATTPTVEVFFFNPTTGAAVTTLTHSTAGLTIQYQRDNAAPLPITLGVQTVAGAYASGGFVHVGGGVYRLDVPVAAAAVNAKRLTILASALPADTAMVPLSLPILTDDPTLAGSTPAAVASEVQTTLADEFAAIPGAVDAAVADNFTAVLNAIPSLSAIANAVSAELDGRAFGVTSQPAGGSTVTVQVREGATVLGTRTLYYNADRVLVGATAVA